MLSLSLSLSRLAALLFSSWVFLTHADALIPRATLSSPSSAFGSSISSPKSVAFAGGLAWIQSLEAGLVLGVDPTTLALEARIPMLDGRRGGLPVEAVATHSGRFLWVSSYRHRDDPGAHQPSFVLVIDTQARRPALSLPAGHVPKIIAWHEPSSQAAVVNWGDNSVDLWDASSHDPHLWRKTSTVLVGGSLYSPPSPVIDRDHQCGLCLRGAAFNADGRYLAVARMHGGGISLIDTRQSREIGVWHGAPQPSRHLLTSPDRQTLYLSSTQSGSVSRVRFPALIEAALQGRDALARLRPENLFLGSEIRSLALDPSGSSLFAAVRGASRIVWIDLASWREVASVSAPSFPVGLGVSPDGSFLWATSQGPGDSVSIWRIQRDASALSSVN